MNTPSEGRSRLAGWGERRASVCQSRRWGVSQMELPEDDNGSGMKEPNYLHTVVDSSVTEAQINPETSDDA